MYESDWSCTPGYSRTSRVYAWHQTPPLLRRGWSTRLDCIRDVVMRSNVKILWYNNTAILYSRVIRCMHLYPHRKRMCTYQLITSSADGRGQGFMHGYNVKSNLIDTFTSFFIFLTAKLYFSHTFSLAVIHWQEKVTILVQSHTWPWSIQALTATLLSLSTVCLQSRHS